MGNIALGTKAETLSRLRPHLKTAIILPCYFFTVQDLKKCIQYQLERIQSVFETHPCHQLIVRSSALAEDSAIESLAGCYHSKLNVKKNSPIDIQRAIEAVVRSYPSSTEDSQALKNQILIQPMLDHIVVSGVMMTRTLNDGSPYYVLNYDDESGKTDTITGGIGVNKTVLIHHQSDPEMIESPRLLRWLDLAKELESHFPGLPLDIEFAETQNPENGVYQLYLLQVRPLTVKRFWNLQTAAQLNEELQYLAKVIGEKSKPRPHLYGQFTLLGEMTDWNPAEMIGTSPRPLAISLYRNLITDRIWRKARSAMGYKHPEGEALMMILGGRPYIDIRNSFNSFLPDSLPSEICEKIINAWLYRLSSHPELHDKVEFNVAQTIYDFDFDHFFEMNYGEILTEQEFKTYRNAYVDLTRQCLNLSKEGTLCQAEDSIQQLMDFQKVNTLSHLSKNASGDALLYQIQMQLQVCQRLGTYPFAVIARHAFIAESFLRSATHRGALTEERVQAFKQSLQTITHSLSQDLQSFHRGTLC
ncbi:MAG: pyruvate, phosphate dikinase, partial [Cyanobacteria bacterium]|nr:pyruvate, phosphate dikinase [Cyanobacteriota bacterium]